LNDTGIIAIHRFSKTPLELEILIICSKFGGDKIIELQKIVSRLPAFRLVGIKLRQ